MKNKLTFLLSLTFLFLFSGCSVVFASNETKVKEDNYWIHLKRFQYLEEAIDASLYMRKQGYKLSRIMLLSSGSHLHPLLLGPFPSKEEALRIAQEAKSIDLGNIPERESIAATIGYGIVKMFELKP
ncbi:uncharacterized protein METZ01_LOCUS461311, partial [marine metagenome]